jgi:Na+-transporting methylmalonyl-CoA/oxaloacetate decarboxylase gamma subunit
MFLSIRVTLSGFSCLTILVLLLVFDFLFLLVLELQAASRVTPASKPMNKYFSSLYNSLFSEYYD